MLFIFTLAIIEWSWEWCEELSASRRLWAWITASEICILIKLKPNSIIVWLFIRYFSNFLTNLPPCDLSLNLELFSRASFQEEPTIGLACFFIRRRIALRSLKRMPVLAKYHMIDFWQIYWLAGKISLTCRREQKAGFFNQSAASVIIEVSLPLWEINNYFVRNVQWYVLSRGKCILELSDKHSGSIRLIEIGVAIPGWRTRHAEKVGNFHFFC